MLSCIRIQLEQRHGEYPEHIRDLGARRLHAGQTRRPFPAGVVGAGVVLVLLCVIISIINPNFLSFGNFVRISQAAMIPLVLGLGATFIILMGSIDLSVEGVLTLSAVILSMLVLNGANGNDYGLVAVLVVLAGRRRCRLRQRRHPRAPQGPVFHDDARHLVHRRRRCQCPARRHGDPHQRSADPRPRRSSGSSAFHVGSGWRLACLAVALVIQNYTRLGRYIYALGGGEELAALSGISVGRVRIMAFTLAGVFYAIGGILAAAQLGLGNAQIGNGRLFTTVTAVVVGGTALSGGQGSVLQTLVGVLIVVVLSNGMVLMGVPPSVQIGVQGLMIIAAVALSIDRKLMRIVK